jgi:hypothetical protein
MADHVAVARRQREDSKHAVRGGDFAGERPLTISAEQFLELAKKWMSATRRALIRA